MPKSANLFFAEASYQVRDDFPNPRVNYDLQLGSFFLPVKKKKRNLLINLFMWNKSKF